MSKISRFVSNLDNRVVMTVLVAVALLTSLGSLVVAFFGDTTPSDWWEGWLQNFSTEMFGAFLTFILLELIAATRDRAFSAPMAAPMSSDTPRPCVTSAAIAASRTR